MARASVVTHTRISSLVLRRFARWTFAGAGRHALAMLLVIPGRTDRLIIAPQDLRTTDAIFATDIYAGRFAFAGKVVNCHGRSPFDAAPPTPEWEAALLGFSWLRHLRAAEASITRANARSLIDEWIDRSGRSGPLAWRPTILARRVISFLSHAPFVLTEADGRFYRRYLRNLVREIRILRYAHLDVADGLPKLQSVIALSFAALCLANQDRYIRRATRRLADELDRQILPDGGHVSRNPGVLIDLLLDLLPLRQTYAARNIAPPAALLNAIDRMMPMLRFFRHGDGNLALFNGMGPTPSDLLATLLAYDDARGTPLSHARYSGYQRLDAESSTVIVDAGAPPPPALSHDAHAGCLSFEFSSGVHRIVANAGMPPTGKDPWRNLARATDAHSTLVYHAQSSCEFVELAAVRRMLDGAPIVHGPSDVTSEREVRSDGTLLAMSHDGYRRDFGLIHKRILLLAPGGHRLDGEDSLIVASGTAPRGSSDDFAVRFHLHPAVKASRLQDGHGVMLVLPNREAWTFDAFEDIVHLTESVFLATKEGPRRTTQIVIEGRLRESPVIRWAFVRSDASPQATVHRRHADREPELPL